MGTSLVTGCAGFIGSSVAAQLLDLGQAVIGVDSINDAYDRRLKQWRLAQLLPRDRFEFHRLDISQRSDMEALAGRLSAVDRVFNLAARAGVRQSVLTPQVYVDTNVTGTLHLLELCRRLGIRKFQLASTSSLYGSRNPMPYREDAVTDGPLSPYAATKKAAEALCYSYHHLHGIDVAVTRYFTVYGPAGRPDMSPFRFVQWISEDRPVTIFGDGSQERDFTYVADIARGTIASLERVSGYEVINLGSDRPIRLLDAIGVIEEAVGRKADLRFQPMHKADMMATWADNTKAREMLDWSPETGFEAGIGELASWYRREREWAGLVDTAG